MRDNFLDPQLPVDDLDQPDAEPRPPRAVILCILLAALGWLYALARLLAWVIRAVYQ